MVYFQQRKGIWEILQRFNGITLKRGKKCILSTKQRETLCKKSSVNNFLPEQCVALLFLTRLFSQGRGIKKLPKGNPCNPGIPAMPAADP